MGMSSSENIKVIEETSGCTRGGARFREKRQRTGEGPAEVEVRYREEQPHGTKRPFCDDEDIQAQATPRRTTGSNRSGSVPTTPRTTPPQGRNAHSMSTCPMCQQQSSNRAPAGGRRPRMAGDEMKLPIFNGNGTDDPE